MSKPASSPILTASTNCALISSIIARVIATGTWFSDDQAISEGPYSGQLPSSRGLSAPSQPTLVEPFGPEWPSCRQILAAVLACTKSVMRRQAATCPGAYIPVQPGVIRPSGETQVISVNTRPAPPTARAP